MFIIIKSVYNVTVTIRTHERKYSRGIILSSPDDCIKVSSITG